MSYYRLSWGTAEVFYLDGDETPLDSDGENMKPGYYWRNCQPGCMPDSDAFGPFPTEAEALEDAEGDTND